MLRVWGLRFAPSPSLPTPAVPPAVPGAGIRAPPRPVSAVTAARSPRPRGAAAPARAVSAQAQRVRSAHPIMAFRRPELLLILLLPLLGEFPATGARPATSGSGAASSRRGEAGDALPAVPASGREKGGCAAPISIAGRGRGRCAEPGTGEDALNRWRFRGRRGMRCPGSVTG